MEIWENYTKEKGVATSSWQLAVSKNIFTTENAEITEKEKLWERKIRKTFFLEKHRERNNGNENIGKVRTG
jgi:hypothetical protein